MSPLIDHNAWGDKVWSSPGTRWGFFLSLPLLKGLRVCFFCESFLVFIFPPCTVFTKCSLVVAWELRGEYLRLLLSSTAHFASEMFWSFFYLRQGILKSPHLALRKSLHFSFWSPLKGPSLFSGGRFPAHSPCLVYCVMKQSCPRDRSPWESCNTLLCITSPLILSCHPTKNILMLSGLLSIEVLTF